MTRKVRKTSGKTGKKMYLRRTGVGQKLISHEEIDDTDLSRFIKRLKNIVKKKKRTPFPVG